MSDPEIHSDPFLLRCFISLDLSLCLDPNLDPAVIDDTLLMQHRVVYHLMRDALDEAQNLALVELDGLVQLIRVDQKEFIGFSPDYFLS